MPNTLLPTSSVAAEPLIGRATIASLASRVQVGDPQGSRLLSGLIQQGLRFLISRALGSEQIEHHVRQTFALIIRGLQKGELGDPERLLDYSRRVLRGYIKEALRKRHGATVIQDNRNPREVRRRHVPADRARREHNNTVAAVLMQLSLPEREALIRFYLLRQDSCRICADLCLTDTELSALRNRVRREVFRRTSDHAAKERAVNDAMVPMARFFPTDTEAPSDTSVMK